MQIIKSLNLIAKLVWSSLTPIAPKFILARVNLSYRIGLLVSVQTNMATQETTSSSSARVSQSHADSRRQAGIKPTQSEGKAPFNRLKTSKSSFHAKLEALPRYQRLKSDKDFKSLRKTGASASGRMVALRYIPNAFEYSRFGFVVGRRISKLAVSRNLIRRRMREVVRRTKVSPGWDLLFIARPAALNATFAELRAAVIKVIDQAHLNTNENGKVHQENKL